MKKPVRSIVIALAAIFTFTATSTSAIEEAVKSAPVGALVAEQPQNNTVYGIKYAWKSKGINYAVVQEKTDIQIKRNPGGGGNVTVKVKGEPFLILLPANPPDRVDDEFDGQHITVKAGKIYLYHLLTEKFRELK